MSGFPARRAGMYSATAGPAVVAGPAEPRVVGLVLLVALVAAVVTVVTAAMAGRAELVRRG
jgi:hypothetical protein